MNMREVIMSDDVFEKIGELLTIKRLGGPEGRPATVERRFYHEVQNPQKVALLYSFAQHSVEIQCDGRVILQISSARSIVVIDQDKQEDNEVNGD